MLGVSGLSNMGCVSFRSRIPAAPIDAVRAKRAGRVKAAPAASAASEALTRPSASAESSVRGGGCGEAVHFVPWDLRLSRLEGDDLRALRRECLVGRDGA